MSMQDIQVQNLLMDALENIQSLTYSLSGRTSTGEEISFTLYRVNEIAQKAITQRNKMVLGVSK